MKDLYKQLALPAETSDVSVIQSAVERNASTHPEVARTCRAVLLVPSRKKVYDRDRQILVTVNALRTHLGLLRCSRWTELDSADFRGAGEYAEPLNEEGDGVQARSSAAAVAFVGLTLLVVFGCPLIATFILSSDPIASDKPVAAQQTPAPLRLSDEELMALEAQQNSKTSQSEQKPGKRTYTDQEVEATYAKNTHTAQDSHKEYLTDEEMSALIAKESKQALPGSAKSSSSDPDPTLPPNGQIIRYTSREGVASLRFIARAGQGSCFIKLYDENSKQAMAGLFVRDGCQAVIKLPAGSLEIRYAVGTKWHGPFDVFGPDTKYLQLDGVLKLQQEDSGQIPEISLPPESPFTAAEIPAGEF